MQQNLEHIRHSLAHLLAAAVLKQYPEAKLAIGPAIEDGFYYDIDLPEAISKNELPKIQKNMKKILQSWKGFEGEEVSAEVARERFKDNPYKLELINEIAEKGEKITLYTSGDFVDLCRGGHVENIKDINPHAFALHKVAGAYWRGDENNPMLTRIYGHAFESKEELEAHQTMLKEAKKRDHKILGKELDLFLFSPLVGPGLPLWTPKGTVMRHLLDNYVWSLRKAAGYDRVEIPHITKKELYETSGHWNKFSDELFKVGSREGHEFAMKPMNCPHHTQIYNRKAWSYRELPQRYANTTMCYRDEQTGELSGLLRVRSFTQDDAHVFCRSNQVEEEFSKIWDIVETFYGTFGFELKVRISLHDSENMEAYLGDESRWQEAEKALRNIAEKKKIETFEAIGEAAFYGPKLDFMAKDAIGREHQVATIQLDMSLPERFDLTCINEEGDEERIVMIHAAIMGSIERFVGVLIEHVAGAFPLWLAPEQVHILPVSEKFSDYAQEVKERLEEKEIRVVIPSPDETLGKRLRASKVGKIPYTLVVGEKEVTDKTVSVNNYVRGDEGATSLESLIEKLEEEIQNKK